MEFMSSKYIIFIPFFGHVYDVFYDEKYCTSFQTRLPSRGFPHHVTVRKRSSSAGVSLRTFNCRSSLYVWVTQYRVDLRVDQNRWSCTLPRLPFARDILQTAPNLNLVSSSEAQWQLVDAERRPGKVNLKQRKFSRTAGRALISK